MNAGRVAVEKNIEGFLELDLPGSKIVVGDGPDRPRLERKYPDSHFAGYKFGAKLAAYLADAVASPRPGAGAAPRSSWCRCSPAASTKHSPVR